MGVSRATDKSNSQSTAAASIMFVRLLECEGYLKVLIASSLVIGAYICRILWYARDVPKIELFYNQSSTFTRKIVSLCTCLNERYVPTLMWGKSGHVQSFLHTLIGRFGGIPDYPSKRHQIVASDGSVISYDIFEASTELSVPDTHVKDLILVVPGICNHAENNYIKAFTNYMAHQGFRIVVFNHTGALKSVELKRPRIFTYGATSDLDQVIQKVIETENVNKIIGLGFSLGGNILLKYLGEKVERQKHFHFATSVCAGYDVPECNEFFKQWGNLRVLYNYGLTRNMLKVIKHHKPVLSRFCQAMEPPLNLNWKKIISAKALHELDTEFTLKLFNERDIDEFYQGNSCSPYLDNIDIPLLLVNAKDDPMIPEEHFKYPKRIIEVNDKALFVIPPHGGHLGFFEGGYFFSHRVTWMDRMLKEYFKVTLQAIKEEHVS